MSNIEKAARYFSDMSDDPECVELCDGDFTLMFMWAASKYEVRYSDLVEYLANESH